ncbi:MAG TPA: hypothetical protein VHB73_06125 [Alphaproteobacteria bacterium]|nr:hypothetical protein [Alphaproteobacteria bacterium]
MKNSLRHPREGGHPRQAKSRPACLFVDARLRGHDTAGVWGAQL